ncbi:uncharacterized protein [Oscarella lobularis]|uniref:uncharacterized protein isoform X2 n=1 Tax=Oscarella lobularis TaxID=121494 RepID=UPI0033137BA9
MEVSWIDECLRDELLDAIRVGDFEGVKECLRKGAKFNSLPPLPEACANGHVKIAELLIDSGAQVDEAVWYGGPTPLQEACSHGHLDVAKLLIDSGAQVNEANKYDGRMALQGACYHGHLDVAKLLIDSGAQVNEANKFGRTALQGACSNGHLDVAKFLIDSGAQVNEANKEACSNGDLDVAKLLIDSGAQVNEANKYGGPTPLQEACSNGHLDVAKLLIDSGAQVNEANKYDGRTALQGACYHDHLDVAKLLIDSGAQVNEANKFGRTALQGACYHGHLDVAKLLIDSGAQVNEANKEACSNGDLDVAKLLIDSGAQYGGPTPLQEACSNGHLDVAKLLIDSGAQVNEANKYDGCTALQGACYHGHLDVAKLLIDSGAQVNEANKFGRTALQGACYHGHLDVAKLLIDSGAQVNEANKEACSNGDLDVAKLLIDSGAQYGGPTPLQGACYHGHLDVAKLLIDSGAQVNEANKYGGPTPLQEACSNGHLDVAKLLIDSGAQVNEANKYGGPTPLQEACSNGHLDVAKLLIDSGAQVNEANKYGRTALQGACYHGHLDVAKLLIDSGAQVNEANKGKMTALREACLNGHLDVAKLLIEAGAHVNEKDELWSGALYGACQNGHLEIAKLLINAGADVNKTNMTNKRTVLMEACLNGHLDVAELLIRKANARNERRALLVACRRGQSKIAKLLIKAGANINRADENGPTALQSACWDDQEEIARLLIISGANINMENSEGHTALHAACWNGSLEIVKLLVRAEADFNKTDLEGLTALLTACFGGHLAIAKLLVEAGADVNKTDNKENSILHFLANHSHKIPVLSSCFDLVKLILLKEPTLITRLGEGGLLPHEIPCPSDVRNFFFNEWTKHRYNKLYSQGTTKQTKIKVCVIGKAKAGKTTLIKTLKNIYWKDGGDDKRTAGMDLSAAKIKSAGEVVFCDFAGQEFFHKTHGLFFSESTTIFLLVVDLREDDLEELKRRSRYFCSFVKCSVVLKEKANFVVVGSKSDLIPIAKIGESKLRQVCTYLSLNFGPWFNFYGKHFVLNCRDRTSSDLDLLRKAISEVKELTIKAAQEVPIIVEAATASFLPTLRHPFNKRQSFSDKVRLFFSADAKQKEEIHTRTMSVMKNLPETGKERSGYLMELSIFEHIMTNGLYPGLTVEVQKLLIEFLQGIGEILVIEDKVILDPTWLCQNIIGPLLSPTDSVFRVSLCCSPPGTTTKDDIQSALEAFNKRKWEHIDETIRLLCHLEICYELPPKQNTYRFPALLKAKRPSDVWSENPEMKIYVGRRVRRAEETDIITPGTMPFLQCHVHNVPCFCGLEPVVWQDGLMIRNTINGFLVEGMITLQEEAKALDFVVRGPVHSERECLKLLNNLMKTGEEVLQKRSPGTHSRLWYISSTELKQLKEFPLAYEKATIDEKIETSIKSSDSVSKGTVIDSLRDLLALCDNHIDFLPYKTRCAIITCLEKDDAGREASKEHLPGLSEADQVECKTAAELFSTWSENLSATVHCLADAARQSNLPYLLALLSEDGAIELSSYETLEAKEDLAFIRTSSPSTIKRRRVEQETGPRSAPSTGDDDEEISCLFDEDPMTALERFQAAKRIQPVWNRVGRVLGPEPFEDFEMHAFGEKRNDHDRALDMLDAWANKFGRGATRRQFIAAARDVGYSNAVASIFSGPQ